MKQNSIEWHEYCQANSAGYCARERIAAERAMAAVISSESAAAEYAAQIARAKSEGRTSFDRDKFNKKRKAVTA